MFSTDGRGTLQRAAKLLRLQLQGRPGAKEACQALRHQSQYRPRSVILLPNGPDRLVRTVGEAVAGHSFL